MIHDGVSGMLKLKICCYHGNETVAAKHDNKDLFGMVLKQLLFLYLLEGRYLLYLRNRKLNQTTQIITSKIQNSKSKSSFLQIVLTRLFYRI